jgi:hypothetical protein
VITSPWQEEVETVLVQSTAGVCLLPSQTAAKVLTTDDPAAQMIDTRVAPATGGMEEVAQVPATGTLLAPKTKEIKEAEKVRLKRILHNFVRGAKAGFPCVCIRTRGGRVTRLNASYGLSKAMDQLVVRELSNLDGEPMMECLLADITDVYSMAEDGETCFPSPVLDAVQPAEKERLLLLVYDFHDLIPEKRRYICLLMESVERREAFLECLRLLCICASHPTEKRPHN